MGRKGQAGSGRVIMGGQCKWVIKVGKGRSDEG